MTRAAIYARYSSERQNALSIADQVKACMRHAEAQGWEVTATFSDAAISGAALANRPGILNALEAADRGEFDLLLTEDEYRIPATSSTWRTWPTGSDGPGASCPP